MMFARVLANVATIASSLLIDHHQKHHRLRPSEIRDPVDHIGGVAGGVAAAEFGGVCGGVDADLAVLHSEELAGADEVGGALEFAAGLEGDLVELDILFELERRERADADVLVRPKVVGRVIVSNHMDRRSALGGLTDKFPNRETERSCDPQGDAERGVRLSPLDLAEH